MTTWLWSLYIDWGYSIQRTLFFAMTDPVADSDYWFEYLNVVKHDFNFTKSTWSICLLIYVNFCLSTFFLINGRLLSINIKYLGPNVYDTAIKRWGHNSWGLPVRWSTVTKSVRPGPLRLQSWFIIPILAFLFGLHWCVIYIYTYTYMWFMVT